MLEQRFLKVVTVAVTGVLVYSLRIADPDLWGHLLYGRFILESGAYPIADPFGFTSTRQLWFAHEYLSQIFLWLVFSWTGHLGLITLKMIVGGVALYFVYRSLDQWSSDWRIIAPVLLLCTVLLGRFMMFRPQLLTLALFSLFTYLLTAHLNGKISGLRLWILLPLMLLWANLHGAFVTGIGLIGLSIILKLYQESEAPLSSRLYKTRELIILLLFCTATTLATPLGVRLWQYIWIEISHAANSLYIVEWRPISFSNTGLEGILFLTWILFFLVAAIPSSLADKSAAKLPVWGWLLSCLPLTFLAFQSIRHIPFAVIWSAPVLVLMLQSLRNLKVDARSTNYLLIGAFGVSLVPALLTCWVVVKDPYPRIRITASSLGAKTPFRAAEFIKINELKGNLYNPLWWGSYLSWELYPEILVSMDGRNVTAFPAETVTENLQFFSEPDANPAVPRHYPTDFLLVPLDFPGLSELRKESSYTEIYQDSDSILFVLDTEAREDLIRTYQEGTLKQPSGDVPAFFPSGPL